MKITLWTLFYISCFLIGANANACKLSIPESYIPTFLNPPVSGHYQKCEEKPEDKCHCVENVDPWVTDLIDGELVHNPDKAFARKLAEDNAEKARKEKEEKCKSFSFKGTTIAALKAEMNEWKDCK